MMVISMSAVWETDVTSEEKPADNNTPTMARPAQRICAFNLRYRHDRQEVQKFGVEIEINHGFSSL
jgi:hypothetical protein